MRGVSYKYSVLGVVLWGSAFLVGGCGIYSFRGGRLPKSVSTISISQFYNNALLTPPGIANTFSEQLRTYFERNSSLQFVPENGDIHFSGQIDSYQISPVAPSASANTNDPGYTALTRLSIVVLVSYENTKDEDLGFELRPFTFFIDFDQDRIDFSASEQNLVEQVFDQVVMDVFNQSLADW